MTVLLIGLLVFFGAHLVPSFPAWRTGLVLRAGAQMYRATFSIVSLVGLVLIIMGKSRAPFVPLWSAPVWGHWVPLLLMPIAFVLLVAAYFPSSLKRYTAHPMLWGVLLWSISHLALRGDLASVLLFGSFAIYAVYAMASAERRAIARRGPSRPWPRNVFVGVVGLGAFSLVVVLHPYLFGVAAIP